jgi:hypothetical protein
MANSRGHSQDLQTPLDLLRKMEHDFAQLEADPADAFAAFDFFVAAEHMVDWRYPSPSDARARAKIRSVDPGKTVSDLANGAKHFEATASRHRSVTDVSTEDALGTAALGGAVLGEMSLGSASRSTMTVTMADSRRLEAVDLARLVLTYWQTELAPGGMHQYP